MDVDWCLERSGLWPPERAGESEIVRTLLKILDEKVSQRLADGTEEQAVRVGCLLGGFNLVMKGIRSPAMALQHILR